MSFNDNIKKAKDGATLLGEIIKVSGDNPDVKEAGNNLGKTALTITKTINNALLPLAAVNFAFEKARKYFSEEFQQDLSKKASAIPLVPYHFCICGYSRFNFIRASSVANCQSTAFC